MFANDKELKERKIYEKTYGIIRDKPDPESSLDNEDKYYEKTFGIVHTHPNDDRVDLHDGFYDKIRELTKIKKPS